MELGEQFDPEIEFYNEHIQRLPPRRDYGYVFYEGTKHEGDCFNVDLVKIKFEDLRWNFKHRQIDLPSRSGDHELMQHWIDNMWEALYNPIWMLALREGDKHKRKWAVISGQHRLRLMDAMNPNHIWVYLSEYPSYGRFKWRITRGDVSKEVHEIMGQNDRAPKKGTVKGICEHCGKETRWRKLTVGSKLDGVHMYCRICGGENPYPWPGRL